LATQYQDSVDTTLIGKISNADHDTKSLLKGLRIIEAVNRWPGMILAHIALRCGLPRTTTHRTLRTLEQNGFVYRDAATGRFFPYRRVLALSSGFDAVARATASVRDEFAALGPTVGWPMHFATPLLNVEDPQMQVEASTDYVSPLAVEKLLPGNLIPLLQCAAGLAWLSSVPQDIYAPILDRAMRSCCERPAQKRWTRPAVEETINLIRRRGFADFYWLCRHTNMVGLSVPVQIDAERSAALTVRFAESAVPVKEAVTKFLPVLRALAAKVSLQTGVPHPRMMQAS
jgi:IclR family mhp operon transcriptional activator